MSTFTRELKWVSWEYSDAEGKQIECERVKTATFKELNRTDRTQHKLHFKLISLFEGVQNNDPEQVNISTDRLYDITVKTVELLCVPDQSFTETDKQEFMNDSIALLTFGMWLVREKFAPFFTSFSTS